MKTDEWDQVISVNTELYRHCLAQAAEIIREYDQPALYGPDENTMLESRLFTETAKELFKACREDLGTSLYSGVSLAKRNDGEDEIDAT